jgi:carboxyl-terminal processing protease
MVSWLPNGRKASVRWSARRYTVADDEWRQRRSPWRLSAVLGIAWAVGATACGDSKQNPVRPTPPSVTPTVHLEELLRLLEGETANGRRVDWARARAQVFAAAGTAQSIPDAYPAIALALNLLDDFESHYRGADGRLIGPSPEPECQAGLTETPSLPPTIGYVRLDACSCDGAAADRYAETVQQAIRTADRPGLLGWIVDLREDRGGNMWPMIAGLGPIFGDGIIGWIIYNNREYEREYRGGAALSLNEPFARVAVPYSLVRPSPKVAVLTADTTNSAGEAITVFFKGRPDTRSFGGPTCGHHHLLSDFRLSNGAILTLKTAHNADRLKRTYAGRVVPDEVVTAPGETIRRAVAWLLAQ